MTFDVEKAHRIARSGAPGAFAELAAACSEITALRAEIEFLRKNRDDVERVKEQREAYATKLEAELRAAMAVVEAARPTITNASEWKQDKFYVSLGALSEAIGAHDKATKAEDSK